MEKLQQEFTDNDQGHVFNWSKQLNDEERKQLLKDAEQINVAELKKIFERTKAQIGQKHEQLVVPFPHVTTLADQAAPEKKRWEEIGFDLIASGKVCILLLAGGQATRLGSTFPKGAYDVGLPSRKSLFQIQVERSAQLRKLVSRRVGKEVPFIPWYIMTSPATYDQTLEFFKSHSYFGLPSSVFFFFNQHMLPCITPEGKILNESAGKVALAPNGNGGLYKALQTSGALADMEKRGIDYVTQYCVDNVLIRVADPVFLGFMHDKQADCAAKVAAKAYPEEPVGVVCLTDGKPAVIEYSEIDPSRRSAVNPETNQLLYNYAHICINSFTRRFLDRVVAKHLDELPFHVAKKKIPSANAQGRTEVPTSENGWKLEMFIFDTFPYSENMVAFECVRNREFSPLKNSAGMPKDSPETCLADLCRMYAGYISEAGGSLSVDVPKTGHLDVPLIEISPLTSYSGEGLTSLKGKTFLPPVHVKIE